MTLYSASFAARLEGQPRDCVQEMRGEDPSPQLSVKRRLHFSPPIDSSKPTLAPDMTMRTEAAAEDDRKETTLQRASQQSRTAQLKLYFR